MQMNVKTLQNDPTYQALVEDFHKRREYIRRGRSRPYILWGYMSNELDGPRPTLHMQDCTGTSGQKAIVFQCYNDGKVPLEYWLPLEPEPEVKKGQIAVPRRGIPDDENYEGLIEAVQMCMGGAAVRNLEEENKAMREELARLTAEKTDKKGAKHEQRA